MKDFLMQVHLESSINKGEDNYLIYQDDPESKVIAVFDGLGGRSAGFDHQTGGQIASKLASTATKSILQQSHFPLTQSLSEQIQTAICQLLREQADLKMSHSRLKGTLTGKRLCTTLALAAIPQTLEDDYSVQIAWIGDSRIYFLSPQKGLQQLSKDDLEVDKDALEMIREDPPMSQYLTADFPQEWSIHFATYNFEEKGCLFVCTDGCFQYLSTPWDFEKLLLQTLLDSKDWEDWGNHLKKFYEKIKQDDISLVLSPLGIETFEEGKELYQPRLNNLLKTYGENQEANLKQLQALWEKYRQNYEARLINLTLSSSTEEKLETDESRVQEVTNNANSVEDETETTLPSSPHNLKLFGEDIMLETARTYVQNHQLNEAISQYQKILASHSNWKNIAYFELGKLYFEQNDWKNAISYLLKLVYSDEEFTSEFELSVILAEAYYHLGHYQEAVQYFLQAENTGNLTQEQAQKYQEARENIK